MGTGSALNTNPDRENANGAIFLNNMIKEISGKDLLTFLPAPDHKGLELPQFNWSRANKLLPEKTRQKRDIMIYEIRPNPLQYFNVCELSPIRP